MIRPWFKSKWVRVGGAIVLLVVIAAAAVPFLVPVDRFRPLLVRVLDDGTGRDIRIGALRLYLVPTVRIRATDIHMTNPQGFPAGDAVTAGSIDLGLAPRALLSRRLDVTHIAVNGIRLNLIRDPAGRTNFTFPGPARSAPRGTSTTPGGGASLLTLDRIGAVTLKNVEITVSSLDARGGPATPLYSLSGVDGRIRSIDPRAADWASALEIDGQLRGARLVTPALAAPVQFPAGDILVKGHVGRASFSASLGGMQAAVTVAAISLDPLSITFTVALPELDVAKLETLLRSGAPNRSSRAEPQTPPTRAQTLPPRPQLLASGEVNIDRLVVAPFTANGMRSRLSVYTSGLHVVSYTLSSYGGTIQGAGAVDYSAAGLPAALSAKVSGVNLEQVVRTLSPSAQKITGTLEATLKLSTTLGGNPAAQLAGGGTFAVRNGSFQGLDLRSTLAQLARALALNVPPGPTKFSYFGGDVRISRQRVYSDSLRLEADDLEGTATGSLGFDKTLDYVGTGTLKTAPPGVSPPAGASPSAAQILGALLSGAGGTSGVRVPFSVRGSLDDPKFSLAPTQQPAHGGSLQSPPNAPAQPSQPLPGLPDLTKLFQ